MIIEENLYDIALHHIGLNESNTFICIIGAMDGVSFDDTRGYISLYGWNGIFVEPIPEQFNKLKEIYSNTNSICENVAISSYNGTVKMLTIDAKAIDNGEIHPCFGGMSAIYPPKNGLSSDGDKPIVEKYGKLIEVPCITPETLFNKHNIQNIDIISIDTEGHDFIVLKNINLEKYKPKVIRIEYINLSDQDKIEVINYLEKHDYVYNIEGQNLDAVKNEYWNQIKNNQTKNIRIQEEQPNVTLVTGIWDLDRSSLTDGWKRDFSHYISKFEELLQSIKDIPLIVFIDPKHENIVWKHRSKINTTVYHQTKEQFNSAFFPFFDKVQQIRTDQKWLSQVGWLSESAQAKMEWYNPVVMSKMFMLHNAKCFNPFNTEYMFWIDGGITNTIHPGYFSHDKVLHKLPNIVDKFLFICFPYHTTTEIHGFNIDSMNMFANVDKIDYVARGGFFGGHIDYFSRTNEIYYSLLNDTLNSGCMGTEESIFTIMTYLHPDVYQKEMINNDGLIATFFEKLKNDTTTVQQQNITTRKLHANNDIILYINAFNSPEQLQMVLNSFEKYDSNFITKTKKILINNTTKNELFTHYDKIVSKYGFEEIRHGNKGICRSRQIAAEHFKDSQSKYMLFFEDDMLLDFDGHCQFGFAKKVNNLLNTCIKIMDNEHYDFLKLSFSEFYGNNSEQWSWHNVPSEKRLKYFGKINKKPFTKFSHIKSYNGTPYAEGEIYYCNWPHIIDQEGNQKLFLDTKWENPFEQTWMSHIYDLTIQNTVKSAILLASPITHNRVHFYEAQERKEN